MIQKDSLSFQSIQNKILNNNLDSIYASIDQYIQEYPNGLFIAEVLNYKIQFLQKEKKWPELVIEIDKLLSKKGSKYNEQALRLGASVFYFELKNFKNAAEYYERLLAQKIPEELRLEALRGIVRSLYQLKDWERGSTYSEQLLKIETSPDDHAYSNLIIGYLEQQNKLYDLSIDYFNKVLNLNASLLKPEAAFQLSFNMLNLGNYKEAENTTLRLIEKYGSDEYWNTKCYILLGDIFIAQNDYFNAKATLQSVYQNSSNPELKAEALKKIKEIESKEKKTDSNFNQ
jgi:tetratricopeptide (TPR) repeat protein